MSKTSGRFLSSVLILYCFPSKISVGFVTKLIYILLLKENGFLSILCWKCNELFCWMICSSFDEYVTEVKSGRLEWSPVHKEIRFWRENAPRLNEGNYELLR